MDEDELADEFVLSDLIDELSGLPYWDGDPIWTIREAYRREFSLRALQENEEKLKRILQYAEEDEDKPRWLDLKRGDPYGNVMRIVNAYDRERKAAIATLGAFQEHVLISLQAMLLLAKQGYGMTHAARNVHMDMLVTTIREAITNICGDRQREWYNFDEAPFSVKNWDVRRLAATKFRQDQDLEDYRVLEGMVSADVREQWQKRLEHRKGHRRKSMHIWEELPF